MGSKASRADASPIELKTLLQMSGEKSQTTSAWCRVLHYTDASNSLHEVVLYGYFEVRRSRRPDTFRRTSAGYECRLVSSCQSQRGPEPQRLLG
jgi:hypothetical protein